MHQSRKVMVAKLETSFLLKDKNELGIIISIMYEYNKVKSGDLNLN